MGLLQVSPFHFSLGYSFKLFQVVVKYLIQPVILKVVKYPYARLHSARSCDSICVDLDVKNFTKIEGSLWLNVCIFILLVLAQYFVYLFALP